MRIGIALSLLVLTGAAKADDVPPLSGPAQSLIEPIFAAYRKVEQAQALLPPAASDSERLIRMGELDQAGRSALNQIDLTVLPPDQYRAAFAAEWREIDRHDHANLAMLKAMLPAEGWFLTSRYGTDAAHQAWLIVQHAVHDLEFMDAILARMEPLLPKGEVSGPDYALLYDRVALHEGRPQRYGSQMICKSGRWALDTLEDPDHVDERRRAIGFELTVAQNVARFADRPPCDQK
jgi:hypothetical protein